MTIWQIVLLASVAVFALKVTGYLIPATFTEGPRPTRIADLVTVAMLAGLVGLQSLTTGSDVVIDARVPAVLVAAALFALRVPFLLVIVAAAGTAALLRALA